MPKLVSGSPERFRNRSEAEFAGYGRALDYLNQEDPGRSQRRTHPALAPTPLLVQTTGALGASTQRWFDDGRHDVWPWARYLLDRVDHAYSDFEQRVAAGRSGRTKQDRVRDFVLLHAPSTFTIADIRCAVPGVSDNTIRLVLTYLKSEGHITSGGTGRGATWHRV